MPLNIYDVHDVYYEWKLRLWWGKRLVLHPVQTACKALVIFFNHSPQGGKGQRHLVCASASCRRIILSYPEDTGFCLLLCDWANWKRWQSWMQSENHCERCRSAAEHCSMMDQLEECCIVWHEVCSSLWRWGMMWRWNAKDMTLALYCMSQYELTRYLRHTGEICFINFLFISKAKFMISHLWQSESRAWMSRFRCQTCKYLTVLYFIPSPSLYCRFAVWQRWASKVRESKLSSAGKMAEQITSPTLCTDRKDLLSFVKKFSSSELVWKK